MSTIYPNYQNKNYYDYCQYVKDNEFYFNKIKYSKPEIDDKCPETMIYSSKSGKMHKYFNYVEKENAKLNENKKMFSKISTILKTRSSSIPHTSKFYLNNKNFLLNFPKITEQDRIFYENNLLDQKIKNLKSEYNHNKLDKEYKEILNYKKIIKQKNNLFFSSFNNEQKPKTDINFYRNSKSKINKNNLPELNHINPKLKTTTNNFFKKSKIGFSIKDKKIETNKNEKNNSDNNNNYNNISSSNFNLPKNITSEENKIDFSNINSNFNKNVTYSKGVLSPSSNHNLNTLNIINNIIDEKKPVKVISQEEIKSINNKNPENNYDSRNNLNLNVENVVERSEIKESKIEKTSEKNLHRNTSKSLMMASNKKNESFSMENLEEKNKSFQKLSKLNLLESIVKEDITVQKENLRVEDDNNKSKLERMKKLEEMELEKDISIVEKNENEVIQQNEYYKTGGFESLNKNTKSIEDKESNFKMLSSQKHSQCENQFYNNNIDNSTNNNLNQINQKIFNKNIVRNSSDFRCINSQLENPRDSNIAFENMEIFDGENSSKNKANYNNSLRMKESLKMTNVKKRNEIFNLKEDDDYKSKLFFYFR